MVSAKAAHAPILHAEDDENDALFMQMAFKKAKLANPLIAVHDGEAAIAYLKNASEPGNADIFPFPCLILTDLKMPRLSGFDLLKWLKEQPHLSQIPAIVLSSSGEPHDRQRASELGAAAFWVKPAHIEMLMALVTEMRDTWVSAHCS
jgi:CheY-like chemotaxis protein